MKNNKEVKPFYISENMELVTFRAKTASGAFRKVSKYLKNLDVDIQDVYGVSVSFVDDCTVEGDQCCSISLTLPEAHPYFPMN